MSNNYKTETPVNGFALQKGAEAGVELTFDWLSSQLKLGKKMKEDEVISQVNVTNNSIILYLQKPDLTNVETLQPKQVKDYMKKEDYNKLLKSGMLWELYPMCLGDYEKDKLIIQEAENGKTK